MPSRQQSPTSSTSGSSGKKAGHQRNPMACTNCRARKIKCDSNKRYPDHPCQRCVNRKLVCEYVAIAHAPSNDTRSRSGSFSSAVYPSPLLHDSNPKSHANISPHMQTRYSPLSTSLHSRSSSRSDSYALSFDAAQYPSSNSSYSDSSSGVDSHLPSPLYGYYGSSDNFGDSIMHAGSHMGQMPNIAMSSTPQYGNFSSGMPGMVLNSLPDQNRYFNRDPSYADWNMPPNASQGPYGAGCGMSLPRNAVHMRKSQVLLIPAEYVRTSLGLLNNCQW
ncbi:hypothetical protein J3R30DRAFT_3693827 [Lentinula aciculospora]|uniref:Zn(2)-C6 fungal-type domain-containing protein n=1 Tax=Lentinula aciculospora TaxID=153920 RepID=A0A9W9ATK9_9AGAR|nr:hypothetical protein J3R30DRAFT_3693827 [Lentinula aciculospora]